MIARKIAYNIVVSTISKVLSIVLALVGIGFVTRYLGPEGFGHYATVLAFLSFFGAIADLGLYSVATREISREGADARPIIGKIFTLRLFSALAIALCAPLLAFFLPYPLHVKISIVLVALSFFFSTSYTVLNGIFQKHLAMDRVVITELCGKMLQVGIIVAAVMYDLGFYIIVSALVVSSLLNFLVIVILSRRYVPFTLTIDSAYWKSFLAQSLPMGAVAIITFFYLKVDTILLSVLQTSATVGIYNAAYKIVENLIFFPAMVVGLMLPLFSRYIFTDKEKFHIACDQTAKIFFLIVVPMIVGVFFLAEDIVLLLGGEAFRTSADILRLLIFALGFIFFGNLFNALLVAGNHQLNLSKALFFVALFNVVGNIILIPRFAAFGAASMAIVTEALVVGIGVFLIARHIGHVPRIHGVWRVLFAGGTLGAFLFAFPTLPLLVLIGCGAALYGALIYLLRVITKEELANIFARRMPSDQAQLS